MLKVFDTETDNARFEVVIHVTMVSILYSILLLADFSMFAGDRLPHF
jgi:hypothetical protein